MGNKTGDFTGRKKQELQEKHEREQMQRAKEVSLITAAEEERKAAEVVDYTKPKPAPVEDTGPVDLTATQDDEDDEVISRIVGDQGDSEPEAGTVEETRDYTVPGNESHPPIESTPQPIQVKRERVTVRARYDMPKVTIGKGTTYNFEAGRQYIVPPHVADHLASKDRVDILG